MKLCRIVRWCSRPCACRTRQAMIATRSKEGCFACRYCNTGKNPACSSLRSSADYPDRPRWSTLRAFACVGLLPGVKSVQKYAILTNLTRS